MQEGEVEKLDLGSEDETVEESRRIEVVDGQLLSGMVDSEQGLSDPSEPNSQSRSEEVQGVDLGRCEEEGRVAESEEEGQRLAPLQEETIAEGKIAGMEPILSGYVDSSRRRDSDEEGVELGSLVGAD